MRQFSIFVPMVLNENFAEIVSFVEFKSEILADGNYLPHKSHKNRLIVL